MSRVNYSEILALPDKTFNARINFFLIINYILKSQNISKEEFATKSGISYSRLKKFLRFDKTNFYYEEMLQICNVFKIPLYELEQGYLYQDFASDSADFSQKYFGTSSHLHTSGTVCYLHRLNYIRTFGMKSFIKLCLNAKIDPIYFVNLHNASNIGFSLTLGQDSRLKGGLKTTDDIEKLALIGVEAPVIHKKHDRYYANQLTNLGKTTALIEKMGDYERNCRFKILDWNSTKKQVDIEYKYESHCDLTKLTDPIAGGWIPTYVGYFFKHFNGAKENPQILETLMTGNSKCIIRVPLQ